MAIGGGSAATVFVDVEGDLSKFRKDVKGAGDVAKQELGGGKLGAAGKIAGAALGGALIAGAAKGISDALNAEQVNADIAGRLGLDAASDEAVAYGEVTSNLYRDAWGESLEEVGQAVTDTAAAFDFGEPEEIEDWTAKALALSETFGLSVEEIMGTASTAFYSGITKDDPGEIFDAIAASAATVPAALQGEILSAGTEYSQFFNQLGFDSQETFGALVQNAGDGAYGIDKTGDAIKEFTIRATDMSTASVDAFEAIGLNAEGMSTAIIGGGDGARAAFDEIVNGILAIEDPLVQAETAIALFGVPLEDLGTDGIPDFLNGLTNSADALEDMDGAADDLADTVGGTTAAKLESFKRKALGELADFAAETLIPALEGILPVLEGLFAIIEPIPGPVKAFAFAALGLGAALLFLAGPITQAMGLVSKFSALLAANPYLLLIAATILIVIVIVKNWDTIVEFLGVAWNWISELAVTVWGGIRDFFEEWWRVILVVFTGGLGLIALWIFDNWDAIKTKTVEVWNTVAGFIGEKAEQIGGFIRTWILDPVDAIFGFFERLPETARNAWDGVSSAIGSAKDGILSALGEISSAADTALGPLDEIAGFVFGGVGSILGFDQGGVVPGPTGSPRLVLAHGGETFVPTHKRGMEGAAGNGGGGGITVNLRDATIRNDDDVLRLARMLAEETARSRRSQGVKS